LKLIQEGYDPNKDNIELYQTKGLTKFPFSSNETIKSKTFVAPLTFLQFPIKANENFEISKPTEELDTKISGMGLRDAFDFSLEIKAKQN